MHSDSTKTCRVCRQTLPISKFATYKRNSDRRHRAVCISCQKTERFKSASLFGDATEKRCTVCLAMLPYTAFSPNGVSKTTGMKYLAAACRKCSSRKVAKIVEANPDFYRDKHMKRLYGVSLAEYNRLFEEQGGTCAICKKPERAADPRSGLRRLSVDHSHATGTHRALLCTSCNRGLGLFQDCPELLRVAAIYLDSHRELHSNTKKDM